MGTENIVFVTQDTKYCFSIANILNACTATEYAVTYENGVAVLRGDVSGKLYGEKI